MTQQQAGVQPTIAERLAAYGGALRYDDIPADVRHRAKRMIIDSIGCAFGAHASEPARIARTLARAVRSDVPATMLGTDIQTSVDLATFANGVLIRFLDYNDGYIGRDSGHPSDSIAAVLACAEACGRDGKEMIAATIVAYETFCRLCDMCNLKDHGFDHATMGALSSVVAAARLMGLDSRQFVDAVNLATAASPSLLQTRVGTLSMWKGCAFANASRNAVFAAMLARLGMTGPAPVFEGRGGYFAAVTHAPCELAPFGGGGQSFKIMECLTKRFPLGQYSQSVAEAAIAVRGRLAARDEIDGVLVETLGRALKIMADSPEKWRPANTETADHSLPYVTAVALLYGPVERCHFDEEYLRDARLLDLVSRVKCSAWPEADGREPGTMLCRITVTTKAGARHAATVEYHRGHAKNPMSDGEIEAKFRALAEPVLARAQCDALLDRLWNLESVGNARELFPLFSTAGQ